MSEFKSCPVCQEQSDQCLPCGSYVVDGERIYYEKLKDFGATKDHEVRFINRIQKHRTTAFFHNGKLYIPSRQGRSVPLAIGLQWDAWQEQQAIIENLKAQLNNMEACYIEKKKQVEELQTENTELQEVVLRDSALATKAQLERNEWQEVVKSQQKTIENLSVRHEVLNIQVDPAHQLKLTEKVSKEISRGSRLTEHRIDLRGFND